MGFYSERRKKGKRKEEGKEKRKKKEERRKKREEKRRSFTYIKFSELTINTDVSINVSFLFLDLNFYPY